MAASSGCWWGGLGGPLGVFLGLGTGAVIGAAVDRDRADLDDGALSQMSATIPVGKTAIVAEVDEYAVEVLDGEMGSLGGTITRRPAAEGGAEMEAAEASAKEARRVMREAKKAEFAQKREQTKEEWDKRVSALKQKLSRHDEA